MSVQTENEREQKFDESVLHSREKAASLLNLVKDEVSLIWEKSLKEPTKESHKSYLLSKGIEALGDVRYGEYYGADALMLPLRNIDGEIQTIQYIYRNTKGVFEKRFHKGGSKNSSFMPLNPIEGAKEIYVCEGYATGVSIQRAMKHSSVVVAFDANNMGGVLKSVVGKYPETRITIAADNDLSKEQNIGLQKGMELSKLYDIPYTYPNNPGNIGTDFNDLESLSGLPEVTRQLEDNEQYWKEVEVFEDDDLLEDQEMRRFPIDSFPEKLQKYIKNIASQTQVSIEMVATLYLPSRAIAVQSLGDVCVGNQTIPLSIFSLIVAGSGERKSAVMGALLKPFRDFERNQHKEYESKQTAHRAELAKWNNQGKGKDEIDLFQHYKDEPQPPPSPKLIITNPTIEGISKQFSLGYPSLGLMTPEGGQILGGYALGKDRNLNGLAGLCLLWDGEPIEQTRSGNYESTTLFEKRLSMGMAIQPRVFKEEILSNKMMLDQGFLSRFLICECPVRAGFMLSKKVTAETIEANASIMQEDLDMVTAGCCLLVEGFKLNSIELSKDALEEKNRFSDEMQMKMRRGNPYYHHKSFSSKTTELAIRIAGFSSLFDNILHISKEKPSMWSVTKEYFLIGEAIALWFLDHKVEIFKTGQEGEHAEKLSLVEKIIIESVRNKGHTEGVKTAVILQKTPRKIGRKIDILKPILDELCRSGRIKSVETTNGVVWVPA